MEAYAKEYLSDVVETKESFLIWFHKTFQIKTQLISSTSICLVKLENISMKDKHTLIP